jgi:cob(I)alamin adenosyltransferase
MLKLSKNLDEVCYPFIQETSALCDFEVVTDELCALIGGVLAYLPDDMPDLHADLEQLQPLAFHVNGSVRGRLAIDEDDLSWLSARMAHYREEVSERLQGFVLPRGHAPVPQLHQARSVAKKAIRALVRVDQEGIEVPLVLPRMCNLMCNFFFVLTLVVNQRRGFEETYFASKSYGKST